MAEWSDPAWLAAAHAWIRAELERLGLSVTGEIEQPHVRPWATALRVPTEDGVVWFKANAPVLAHEAQAVRLLSARRPDVVPPPLALDRERGWLLSRDAGTRLRELVAAERSLDRWLDVLPLYAGLQLDVAVDADELAALGVPEVRLAGLPARYEALLDELEAPPEELERLRSLMPRVRELAAELAAAGIAETIQHDDLHDGQVFVRDGRYAVLDWGDACISHPFFSLAVTLQGQLAWGLDDVRGSLDVAPFRAAYLRPYEERLGRPLEREARLAEELGWVCRAVNAFGSAAEEDEGGEPHAHTRARLAMFSGDV